MASAWIISRETKDGGKRYRVKFRPGGREAAVRYAGSFRTMREARIRRDAIAGDLAALRMPELYLVGPDRLPTLAELAERWRASLADLVAELHAAGLKKQTLRKTLSVGAMVFDHARIDPNPWRDRLTVKLPREERRELHPPTAAHVEAVVRLLPKQYRLPALVLDATGMRIGEAEALTWGDVDEPRQRWRVSGAVAKTGRARWVPVPDVIFEAVTRLVAREDRVPERPVFQGFGGDRFRTAITRACTAAGVPAFSPHDLRHRRVSLLHLGGMPWARMGELVGHDDLVTTARTYTHVVADEGELDYAELMQ
jgi:integrase